MIRYLSSHLTGGGSPLNVHQSLICGLGMGLVLELPEGTKEVKNYFLFLKKLIVPNEKLYFYLDLKDDLCDISSQ
jgi:hypothetical protein